MSKNVLSLGEMIVLSARLATIEHVKQEMDAIASKRAAGPVGDEGTEVAGASEDADAYKLSRPAPDVLRAVFRRLEKTTPMPRLREAA